jgi:hypothetical protein
MLFTFRSSKPRLIVWDGARGFNQTLAVFKKGVFETEDADTALALYSLGFDAVEIGGDGALAIEELTRLQELAEEPELDESEEPNKDTPPVPPEEPKPKQEGKKDGNTADSKAAPKA